MYRESYEYLVSLVLHLDIAGNTLTVSNLVGPLFGTDRSSLNGLLTTFLRHGNRPVLYFVSVRPRCETVSLG